MFKAWTDSFSCGTLPFIEVDATSEVHDRALSAATLLLDPSKDPTSPRSVEISAAIAAFQEHSYLPARKQEFLDQESKRNPGRLASKPTGKSSSVSSSTRKRSRNKENATPNSATDNIPKEINNATTLSTLSLLEAENKVLKQKLLEVQGELETQKNKYSSLSMETAMGSMSVCNLVAGLRSLLNMPTPIFTDEGTKLAQYIIRSKTSEIEASEDN